EGILKTLLRSFGPEEPRRPARFPGRAFGEELLANDHGEHVASRENEKVLSAVLDLGSAVLGVDDLVANRDVERNAVAIVVDAAWAYCDDLALLGLLLRGVRNDEPGSSGLLGLDLLDDNAILERLDGDCHVDLFFLTTLKTWVSTLTASVPELLYRSISTLAIGVPESGAAASLPTPPPPRCAPCDVPNEGVAHPLPRVFGAGHRVGALHSFIWDIAGGRRGVQNRENGRMETRELVELLSADGLRLLDSLPQYTSATDVLRTVSELRAAGHSPGLVASVLSQSKLRARASGKFGPFAERMLFTEAGLEQATRLRVAALHAGRFQTAGLRRVADLGCGIGADALAMAALDLEVTAVEIDEVTAAIAAYNLAPWPNT